MAGGHCSRCGDKIGPWSFYSGIGWLCDACADEEDEKREREKEDESDDGDDY